MQFVRHDGVIFTPPSAPTARGCLHPTPSGRLKQSLAVPAAMLQLLLAIVAVAEAQSHAYGAPQRLPRDSGPKNNAPSALRHRSEDYRSVSGLMHCRSTSQPSARPRVGSVAAEEGACIAAWRPSPSSVYAAWPGCWKSRPPLGA